MSHLDLGKESEPYDLFVFAINAEQTRAKYITRLNKFFEIICIDQEKKLTISEKCSIFVNKAKSESGWLVNIIIRFLQYQKERVNDQEITGSTLRNYVKVLKLFCEMNDLLVPWKKLTRGLPKAKNYADDRVPRIDEIQKIIAYPDWRMKAIVCTMASSGIRLGAWDYLSWENITPIIRDGQLVAAKIVVYAGDQEQYFSFLTPEAFSELQNWIDFRKNSGENITGKSCVMRDLWNTRVVSRRRGAVGLVNCPVRLKSSGIKRLMEDALWSQGIRKRLDPGKRRHEFQVDHGYRKWFKTRCELSGMKSINIEILMGHSIGISDSYYRIPEDELLTDYLKAVNFLTKNESTILKVQVTELSRRTKEIVRKETEDKDLELQQFKEHNQMNMDAIAALSGQVTKLTREIEFLKKTRTSQREPSIPR
jgi:integrase